MLIEVTAQDIKDGVRYSPDECPVARAMIRQGVTGCRPVCGGLSQRLLLHHEKRFFQVPIPAAAADWIQEFDRGQPVQPFSFMLELSPKPPC